MMDERDGQWKVAGVVALFAAVWILAVVPLLNWGGYFQRLGALAQFALYNFGYFALLSAFFAFFLGWFKGAGIGVPLFMALDNLQPPFYVSYEMGLPAITDPAALPKTSIDAVLYELWRWLLDPAWKVPFTDVRLIYVAVYVVSTGILLTVAVLVFLHRGERIEEAL